jgi:Flp pilus assembly protein TadG
MIVQRLTRDERGVAAVEFAITSPVYFLALFGLAQAGLWLWADFSLQRAADAASRWASIQCGPKLTACPTASQLQGYAVNNIVGLSVPSSAFSLTTSDPNCSGALVNAAYGVPTFTSGLGLPNITVHVSACYPI